MEGKRAQVVVVTVVVWRGDWKRKEEEVQGKKSWAGKKCGERRNRLWEKRKLVQEKKSGEKKLRIKVMGKRKDMRKGLVNGRKLEGKQEKT